MNIVIFGANGTTGRLAAEQAGAEGHAVTAVTRHPEDFPVSGPRLRVMEADVLDSAAVERAVAGRGRRDLGARRPLRPKAGHRVFRRHPSHHAGHGRGTASDAWSE
ncbi:NAD(P)H-binding protein [Streptomyces sp. L7]